MELPKHQKEPEIIFVSTVSFFLKPDIYMLQYIRVSILALI